MEVDERTVIDPAEYFNPDAPRPDEGPARRAWYPVSLSIAGVLTAGITNLVRRRPFNAGIQQHLMAGSLGFMLGYYVDSRAQRKAAHRDLMYYHYIRSHPEDFPPIERKKFSEVFEPWIPIR